MAGSDIIVIGGSAGALEPLTHIVRQLPRSLGAAIFVVLHTSPASEGALPQILERHGILPARFAMHGEPVEYGMIYVAPPDQHLELASGKVAILHGPRENGFRPAIDPLFRSAARAYHGRVVGVLLSGALDDGTFGLMAIKQAGGAAVVQHPYEALIPALPMNAIQNVEVDKIARAHEIGQLLVERAAVSGEPTAPTAPLPAAVGMSASDRDVSLAGIPPDQLAQPPSLYVCPECGGTAHGRLLWELEGNRWSADPLKPLLQKEHGPAEITQRCDLVVDGQAHAFDLMVRRLGQGDHLPPLLLLRLRAQPTGQESRAAERDAARCVRS